MWPIDTTREAAPMTLDSISADRAAPYRLGGVAAVVLGASYLVVTVLYSLAGPAPTGGQAHLEYLAQRITNWWGITGFSVLTDFLFLPLALALYLALKGISKNAAIVGSGLLAMFAILDLAVTWPNYASLIVLSGDYAAATTDAQRASLIAAASYPSSVLESPLFPVYVILVPAVGIAILGIVMLRGTFNRAAAWLGVLTGVLGTIAVVGPWFVRALDVTVIITAVLTTVWVFVVGYELLRPGRR
jgi:hypothetical protein